MTPNLTPVLGANASMGLDGAAIAAMPVKAIAATAIGRQTARARTLFAFFIIVILHNKISASIFTQTPEENSNRQWRIALSKTGKIKIKFRKIQIQAGQINDLPRLFFPL
ncbi:MAG: hypothetical protein LBK75_07745 [Oscillospiraceae bacterium]|jgi:hypothetical protein|nr:hypothetical protein [Oscillospiraceae bacterium]